MYVTNLDTIVFIVWDVRKNTYKGMQPLHCLRGNTYLSAGECFMLCSPTWKGEVGTSDIS